MTFLAVISRGRSWWIMLLLLPIFMLGVALYYQHVLAEWPCVLCIHVRILLALLMLIAALALAFFKSIRIRLLAYVSVAVIAAGLLQRSWMLLATERGWVEGECSVDMGLPAWFAIDQWLPDVFAAWTSCGYTPVMAGKITMAEMLLGLSLLLLISNALLLFKFMKSRC